MKRSVLTATAQTLRKQPNKGKRHATALRITSTIVLLCACSGGGGPTNPTDTVSNESASPALFPPLQNLSRLSQTNSRTDGRARSVMIYTLSNGASRNEVVSFVSRGGALRYRQSFDTGGLGDPSVAGTVQGSIATVPATVSCSRSMRAATRSQASASAL